MNIIHKTKPNKKIRIINIYENDSEKKKDGDFLYMNFKREVDEKKKEMSVISFAHFIRSIVQRAKSHTLEELAFDFEQIRNIEVEDSNDVEKTKLLVKNISLAEYVYDTYKTKKEKRIKRVEIFGKLSKEEKRSFEEALMLSDSTSQMRDISNTPAQDMTPTIFSQQVKKMFKGVSKTSVKILEDKETQKLKMGLYNAVGRGSIEKSKFIIVEYKGGKKSEKPQIMVGKGICYDTGGLSLKTGGHMMGMHMDMSGASTVAAALLTLAKLKVSKNIIAIMPAVENAISGNAYRPGDILTAYDKTTVEIKNTDAEGRLVLADAISYAHKKYNPEKIVDVATLTGASLVALGQKASVIMTNSKEMERDLRDLGNKTGDRVWPLPVWKEFESEIGSDFADIANLGKSTYGGTITAGMFMHHFIKNTDIEWTHIDMAPRMESAEGDNLAKGATGEPVHLLVEYFKK